MVPRKARCGNQGRTSRQSADFQRSTGDISARSSNMVFGVFGRFNEIDWIDVSAAARNTSTIAIALRNPHLPWFRHFPSHWRRNFAICVG
jgi:hypothetical protein